jgi:hypothetical protein
MVEGAVGGHGTQRPFGRPSHDVTRLTRRAGVRPQVAVQSFQLTGTELPGELPGQWSQHQPALTGQAAGGGLRRLGRSQPGEQHGGGKDSGCVRAAQQRGKSCAGRGNQDTTCQNRQQGVGRRLGGRARRRADKALGGAPEASPRSGGQCPQPVAARKFHGPVLPPPSAFPAANIVASDNIPGIDTRPDRCRDGQSFATVPP